MGKKAKKTRWRTLTLNGHQSDSEESHSTKSSKYSKFFYSTHSSPVRKFQNDNDSNKTTRSNSTTSEQKTTFNEDEYTRITTPRQDVLFKKGYLNKPKNYQTQTSTGTCSTTSTCTPDHQSADGTEGTDLEYESQLVFPNGFIDPNGIYYINSFEPFPFVVYNAPICYPEYPRAKRYSTDSLTESVSPLNEESGDACDEPSTGEEPRRQKKRRRRKISRSKSITSQESTDSSDAFKTDDAQSLLLQSLAKTSYSLKPDAEEFIPRNLRAPDTYAFEPGSLQFVPNFIPVNFIGDLQRAAPLLPVNFVPAEPKLYPTYINVIPEDAGREVVADVETKKKKNDIDIAKIVSKLEEAAKQQKVCEDHRSCGASEKTRGNQSDTVAASGSEPPQIQPMDFGFEQKEAQKYKECVTQQEEDVEDEPQQDDLFESFDVSLLVDVVPPSQLQQEEPAPAPRAPTPPPPPAEEEQQKIKKNKKKAQKVPVKRVMVTDLPLPQAPKVTETPQPIAPKAQETPKIEKKKKKKKKPQPLLETRSASSSNATLNADESYDFLLENSLLENFEQKTNVEISHELDRMIQKGMYAHLEEKMRSLNLNANDDFFKVATNEGEGSRAASKLNLFAGWSSQEFQDKGEDYPNTTIDLTSSKNFISVSTEPILNASPSPSEYPITRAVKEWMTKTRENTPDVEILKSPNTIYKEFYVSDNDDDDVTVWSARDQIEECEEAVEVYESSYGKNEDFLKIKDDVDAHIKTRNYPRHGDLPYKAICCNLM
ncbi:hypothetical protein FQR65_LT15271 [Abscondita terminalis]|nr:hypothetical protein FQR65_LT15271 [Abscondita terminalis]